MSASPLRVNSILHILAGDRSYPFSLREDRYSLGRSIKCSIRISNTQVSRLQAVLEREPSGSYSISDGDGCGTPSSNGTYLNGRKITRQILKNEDVIHFGSSAVKAVFYHAQTQSNSDLDIPEIEEEFPDETMTELVSP